MRAVPQDTKDGRRATLLGVLACAGAIVLCEALVYRYLFQYGVSNVWRADGASQDIPALIYFHQWVTAVLTGHGSAFGAWSWRLGLGADAFTSLSYYVADPFALLSLPFPARMLEYVYEGIFLLKILCAGLAAYYYLLTIKAKRVGAIAGTLVYVFTGFILGACLKHPWFVNPMIYFPLILAGTEHVFARRRWYLLVAAIFVAAATDYYFFYQVGIIAILYAVARYVEIAKPGDRLRRLLPDGSRVAGWYALGTVLACFTLVPVALAVVASSRETFAHATPLLFSIGVYYGNIVSFFSARGGAQNFSGGFAILALLAATVVFLRRGNFALKIMLSAFVVLLLSPTLSKAMNGFLFPSYRFFFMGGLFLAAAVAYLLSEREPLSRRELTWTAAVLAIYGLAALWAVHKLHYPLLLIIVPLGIGALTWGLFAAERVVADRAMNASGTDDGDRWTGALRWGVLALLVAGIASAGVANFDKHFNPALSRYLPQGTVMARYSTDPGNLIPTLPFDGLQRTDKTRDVLQGETQAGQNNDPLAEGYAGLGFYYSVMQGGISDYTTGLAVRPKRFAFTLDGFDDRASLDTLDAVRYYLTPAERTAYVPYGFTRASMLGTETVYENRFPLPVGYVYHSAVASDTYAAMAPLDKQQALLQGVVLDAGQAPAIPRIVPALETSDVTYTLTPGPGMAWDETAKHVSARKNGASARLTFAPVSDAELYVEMTGVSFKSTTDLYVSARAAGPLKLHRFMKPGSGYYWGDTTLLINLGYYANGTTSARLVFPHNAQVDYTSFKVIAVPMTRYAQQVGVLAADGMRDVQVGTDTLSGTVTSHGDGLLFLSIPYSTGWSATVDGVPAPVMRANVAFSGIAITGGTHLIELHYATPGLRTGILISLIALLLTAVLVFLTERRIRSRRALAEEPPQDVATGGEPPTAE
jgi:uncharacterized membrane protein YfhO